jgi:hypothetical protein
LREERRVARDSGLCRPKEGKKNEGKSFRTADM